MKTILAHTLLANPDQQTSGAKFGYPEIVKMASRDSLGDQFLWYADLPAEPLFVDQMHYSAQLSKEFAD